MVLPNIRQLAQECGGWFVNKLFNALELVDQVTQI